MEYIKHNANPAVDLHFVNMEENHIAKLAADLNYVKCLYVKLQEIPNTTVIVLPVSFTYFPMNQIHEITKPKKNM